MVYAVDIDNFKFYYVMSVILSKSITSKVTNFDFFLKKVEKYPILHISRALTALVDIVIKFWKLFFEHLILNDFLGI